MAQCLHSAEDGPAARDISRFFPRIDRIFPGEALYSFFGADQPGG